MSGSSSESFAVQYTGQVQVVNIGTTGVYALTVEGADGGTSNTAPGGSGAIVTGDFSLAAGTQLEIVAGGGGGGSFIYDETTGIFAGGCGWRWRRSGRAI